MRIFGVLLYYYLCGKYTLLKLPLKKYPVMSKIRTIAGPLIVGLNWIQRNYSDFFKC